MRYSAGLVLAFTLFVNSVSSQDIHIQALRPTQAERIAQLEQHVADLEARLNRIETVNMPWISWYLQYFMNGFRQIWGQEERDLGKPDRGPDKL